MPRSVLRIPVKLHLSVETIMTHIKATVTGTFQHPTKYPTARYKTISDSLQTVKHDQRIPSVEGLTHYVYVVAFNLLTW